MCVTFTNKTLKDVLLLPIKH